MTDIDEIKSRINIVDIVSERVPLKKAGRNFKGLCPFHSEKTPSFIVSPDRQTFHCFGCGKGGSIFDFVMLIDHVDFPEALETLADRAGVKLARTFSDTPESKRRSAILAANHLASEYYQYLLAKHSVGDGARQYLKSRGVSDKSIQTFSLGYSPNTWDGLYAFMTKKGYDESLLESAGLIIRGNRGYYDRFRGRVMFALKDHRGNVLGFSGRVLDPKAKEAKYINTSETPVYTKGKVLYGLDVTKDAIQKANEAILMEGELDVISSFQAGISNAVAIKGSAVTEDHARLLRRFAERLVFALDSDLAGDAAARRGIEIAERIGFDMRVVRMPLGKDPDEAARENAAAFKKAIKESEPIYDYFLSSAVLRFDAGSAFGKRKISDEFLPVLSKIDNPIVQGHYVRKLADSIDVPEETVREGLARYRSAQGRMVGPKPTESDVRELLRIEKAELYVLALLVQGDTATLWKRFSHMVDVKHIGYLPVRSIMDRLGAYLAEHGTLTAAEFAKSLPTELVPVFDEAFLWDISAFIEDEAVFLREWDKALFELRRLHIRRHMEDVGRQLKATDASSDAYELLQQRLKEATAALAVLEKGA